MAFVPQNIKILVSGVMGLILCLGFARFSYTPMLPIMQQQVGLSETWGGWLASVNYLGYMSGAFLASVLVDLRIKDALYRVGLVLAVLSTAGMGLTDNVYVWAVLRYVSGLSSAAGLLIGSGLILNWLMRHGYRSELGIHFSGTGFGIAFSGLVVMVLSSLPDTTLQPVARQGWAQWQYLWFVYATIGVVFAWFAWRWLPRPPADLTTSLVHSAKHMQDKPLPGRLMYLLFAAYFCAGYGYVINATFIVDIVKGHAELSQYAEQVWVVVGLAAAPACWLLDRLARYSGELNALIVVYLLQIVSILLPALWPSVSGMFLSAALFGFTFMGTVSLMLTMVGKLFPSKPSKPMARITIGYGIAQIFAPALAGYLAERSGNYDLSLYLAALVMCFGVGLLLVFHYLKQAGEKDG
jgi:MFS family permease